MKEFLKELQAKVFWITQKLLRMSNTKKPINLRCRMMVLCTPLNMKNLFFNYFIYLGLNRNGKSCKNCFIDEFLPKSSKDCFRNSLRASSRNLSKDVFWKIIHGYVQTLLREILQKFPKRFHQKM